MGEHHDCSHGPKDLSKDKVELRVVYKCMGCGIKETCTDAPEFSVCSACRVSPFCSVACQKKSWPSHKAKCKSTVASRNDLQEYESDPQSQMLYAQYDKGGKRRIRLAEIDPLFYKFMEIYKSLFNFCALNASGYFGGTPKEHGNVLWIKIEATDDCMLPSTPARSAFKIKEIVNYTCSEFFSQSKPIPDTSVADTMGKDFMDKIMMMRMQDVGLLDSKNFDKPPDFFSNMIILDLYHHSGSRAYHWYKNWYMFGQKAVYDTPEWRLGEDWEEYMKKMVAEGKGWHKWHFWY